MTIAERKNAQALALLRIIVGLFFCVFGEYKVFGTTFTLHGGFQSGLQHYLDSGSAYPFARPFLAAILAHSATPIAFLVAYGELAIGLSLVAGVLSRLASVFGFILMILIWSAAGYPGAHLPFWIYCAASLSWSILALCFVVLVLGRPEQAWSIQELKKATVSPKLL